MKILKLTVFLAVISALAGGVLSYVNQLTAPVIAAQDMAAEQANLEVIFPGAIFSKVEYDDSTGLITGAYKAEGEGYAFKAEVIGYNTSSPVQFLIGFDNDGNIVGFEVLSQQETNGLGAKVAEPEFKAGVVGKTVNDSISAISGATMTSNAVLGGINAAKEVYASLAGVEVSTDAPSAPSKETITLSDDFSANEASIVSEENGVYTIEAKGFQGVNKFEVSVENGVVVSISMIEFNDTAGIGDQVNEDYLSTLVGADLSSEVDVVSSATYTSKSALAAVQLALNGGTAEVSGEDEETPESSALYETENAVITAEADGVYTVEAQGFQGTNVYEITVQDGSIAAVVMTEFNDTAGIGDQVNEEYLAKFIGVEEVDESDVVATATFTSRSAQHAVSAVLEYLKNEE